jgi:hypothetical protein
VEYHDKTILSSTRKFKGGHPTKLPMTKFGRTPIQTQRFVMAARLGVNNLLSLNVPQGTVQNIKTRRQQEVKHPKTIVCKAP